MSPKSSRALVTGGAGFIGSHVAKELLRGGHEVVVLDDLSGGFKANVPSGAQFVKGSINDVGLLDRLFKRHRFEYVFHLAAYAAEGLSHFIKRFNYTNNVVGSVNLINEAVKHNVKCFVYTSSIAVYGTQKPPLTEDVLPVPEDSYGIAKYAVELELKISHEMFGLNYIIFRPHNVYGENQNLGDKFRNVIGIFMNNIMRGKPLVVFGDGRQTRAFSHVSDVAPAIARSVKSRKCYGQTINIGADKPYSINQLARAVMIAMGSKARVVHVKARNEVKHAYSDHKKVVRFFGRRQSMDLDEGLALMAAWAKKAGARKVKGFSAIEVSKNMPEVWRK